MLTLTIRDREDTEPLKPKVKNVAAAATTNTARRRRVMVGLQSGAG